MIVISDTSPIRILVRLGYVEVLYKIFAEVFIPPAVERELTHPKVPQALRDWMASRPGWLITRVPVVVDARLSKDLGEREALSLARELKADLILVDDQEARRTAKKMGIPLVGAVGVLERASQRGLLHLPEALERMRNWAPDFRIDDHVLDAALERDAARRRSRERGGRG